MKRVPVVLQMEAVECGAASLGMILAWFGRWVPLELLREDCGVSRDGSNARNILRAARAYGLQATAYKMEPSALKRRKEPAILHWEFNHFVVFTGYKKGKFFLNDPGRGQVVVSEESFDRSFTGVVLTFEKGEQFEAGGKRPSLFAFMMKRLNKAKEALLFSVIVGILTAGVGLLIPLFSQVYMDHILGGNNASWFLPFMIAFLVVIFLNFAIQSLDKHHWVKMEGSMAIEANSSFMWHLLHLPIQFFSQRYIGDLVKRQQSNQLITASIIRHLAPVVINISLLLLYVVIMLKYNVLMTIIAIVAVVINIFVTRYISVRQMNLSRIVQKNQGKLYGVTMASINNMETIKAAGAEDGFFEHWAGYFATTSNSQGKANRYISYMNIIPLMVAKTSSNLVLMVGVFLILRGDFTIGMLMAFQGFMTSFLSPVYQLQESSRHIIGLRSQMERVEDVFNMERDVKEEEQKSTERTGSKLRGKVEMKNVTFGYNKLSEPLLKDFSLTIEPSKSVAIVGGSGCGKSTITKLISGLYEPWSGEVIFDDVPRREISREVLTNSIAVVDQDIVMFEGTVADNIKIWDQSIEDFVMIMASNDAQIREDIVSRHKGFDAEVIDGGTNFSGGQRQRIELAAALAREPVILILDEATSALDTETEKHVMRSIRMSGVSLIVVAHRMSTIRDCDEIIVLDKGNVMERGNHESLMAQQGHYYELMKNL